MLRVELRGNKRIANKLMRSTALINKRFDKVTAREVATLSQESSNEPEPPPKPTYQRTGFMMNSWDTKQYGLGVHAVINNAPYSGFVVGVTGTQAWMHDGYWWTVDEIINQRQKRKRFLGALLSEVHEVINGTG